MRWSTKTFLFFTALTSLSGCASVKYNYVAEAVEISEPPIGEVVTAYVGDNLLRQGRFRLHEAVILLEEVRVGGLGTYTLSPGEYLMLGSDEKAAYYNPGASSNPGNVRECALCDPFQSLMDYLDEPKVCGVSVFGAMACRDGINLERRKIPIYTEDSFQQTLIYSGMIGDKLNIGYREFSNSLARPAFNNDVEYDLGASNVIGYKGAQIEVVEATNEFIRYRVVRNFNDALR